MKIGETEVNDVLVLAIIYTVVDLEEFIIELPRLSFLLKLVGRLVSVVAMLKSFSCISNLW